MIAAQRNAFFYTPEYIIGRGWLRFLAWRVCLVWYIHYHSFSVNHARTSYFFLTNRASPYGEFLTAVYSSKVSGTAALRVCIDVAIQNRFEMTTHTKNDSCTAVWYLYDMICRGCFLFFSAPCLVVDGLFFHTELKGLPLPHHKSGWTFFFQRFSKKLGSCAYLYYTHESHTYMGHVHRTWGPDTAVSSTNAKTPTTWQDNACLLW